MYFSLVSVATAADQQMTRHPETCRSSWKRPLSSVNSCFLSSAAEAFLAALARVSGRVARTPRDCVSSCFWSRGGPPHRSCRSRYHTHVQDTQTRPCIHHVHTDTASAARELVSMLACGRLFCSRISPLPQQIATTTTTTATITLQYLMSTVPHEGAPCAPRSTSLRDDLSHCRK